MELSQLLSGASTLFGGGATSQPASADSGSAGGLLGSFGSGAALGGAIGSIVPGVGTAIGGAVGGIISSIGSLFGGHGEPGHENADIQRIANDNDISFQEAADVCGWKQNFVREGFDEVCRRSANDRGYFQGILAEYNRAHSGSPIQTKAVRLSGQYGQLQAQAALMFSNAPAANPLANLSLQGAQQAASSQQLSLEEYLKVILQGALSGAQAGAAGAAADTPAGKDATWTTIKTQAKKYELVLVGLGLGLGALTYKAFNNNGHR